MSHGFKFKYDEMRSNDPTDRSAQGQTSETKEENYWSGGNVRNVCFVMLDGNMIFLNYAYLVSGEFMPPENRIILSFTTHVVVMDGVFLEGLFKELMNHVPRFIVCVEPRYNVAYEKDQPIVNSINVKSNTG